MKCARKPCLYQAKPGRLYCSPDCAQLDRVEESSDAEAMAESFSRAAGEALEPSSNAGAALTRSTLIKSGVIRPSESDSAIASAEPTRADEGDTSPESEPFTGSDLRSRDDSDEGANGLVRLMDSLKPSESSEQARSNSMTLIDDSARHLHELMKSVAPSKTSEPEKIKSACEAARQMTSLLRLKLEILREFRK